MDKGGWLLQKSVYTGLIAINFMYKVIKKETFNDGEIEETVYAIMKNGYYYISVDKKDWEVFKKAIEDTR